jgi:hypothetical protein
MFCVEKTVYIAKFIIFSVETTINIAKFAFAFDDTMWRSKIVPFIDPTDC